MKPRLYTLFLLYFCTLFCTTGATALTTPQWSQPLALQQPTNETTLDWLPAGDGETILATALQYEVVVRRVRPDGSFRQVLVLNAYNLATTLYGSLDVAMAADSVSDDTMLLVSERGISAKFCSLVRLDANGQRKHASSVPNLSADDGACLELALLPDGSIAVLRTRALVRLNADGTLRWHRSLWPAVRDAAGTLLRVDTQQRLVIAGGEAEPTVHRFDLDGMPVSTHALLQPALPGAVAGLDLLDNGDIVVAGSLDPPGNASHTGFLVRLASSGQAQLLHTGADDVPFTYSIHDDAGLLYAQADDGTVRAIAAADGQLLWQRAGRHVAALAAGAVLVQAETDWRATAVSPQNVPLWSTPIPHAPDRAEVAIAADGGVRLVADIASSSTDCGPSPALLALAASDGSIVSDRRICRIEALGEVRTLSVLPQAGVLVQLREDVRLLDDSGIERWRFDARTLSGTEARSVIQSSALLPDGGAWVLSVRPLSPPIQPVLRRLGADGSVLQRWNVPVPPDYAANSVALVASADEVVLLIGLPGKLRWVRYTQPGDLREIRDFEFASVSNGAGFSMSFPAAPQRLAGGDVVLGYSWMPQCGFLCPPRKMPLVLLRLGRDGAERWRHAELDWYSPFAGFNSDGSAVAMTRTGTSTPGEIQRIDANGVAAPRQPLGVPITAIAGPSRDRYLLLSDGNHHVLDASGNLTATGLTLGGDALDAGSIGFLLWPYSADTDALLIDPLSYTVSARFDVDGNPDLQQNLYTSHWKLGEDGSVYVATLRESGSVAQSGARAYLTRFAVPGSAAADIVFIDRFE